MGAGENDRSQCQYAWQDPESDFVATRDGPHRGRWYTYRDWLAVRRSSRRLGCDLARPDGAPRCYAPTTDWVGRTDIRDSPMRARVWQYIPPSQWAQWEREYRTPDEATDDLDPATP